MTARADGKLRADAITEVERPWVELVDRAGMEGVWAELVRRGTKPSMAAKIASWLVEQSNRVRSVSGPTASSYRHELRRIGSPDDSPTKRAIGGYVNSHLRGRFPFRNKSGRFNRATARVAKQVAA